MNLSVGLSLTAECCISYHITPVIRWLRGLAHSWTITHGIRTRPHTWSCAHVQVNESLEVSHCAAPQECSAVLRCCGTAVLLLTPGFELQHGSTSAQQHAQLASAPAAT